MVSNSPAGGPLAGAAAAPPSKSVTKRAGKKSQLTKKLIRDMRENAMQFLAMILLCFLGTWVFAGLDGTWRLMDLTVETWGRTSKRFSKSARETLLSTGRISVPGACLYPETPKAV